MLVVSNLSYTLPSGDALFSHLSFSCQSGCTAIIGRNGIGKSTLLNLIAEPINTAMTGSIQWQGSLEHMQQRDADCLSGSLRIADILGITELFDALYRVEQGVPNDQDIDLLDGHWDMKERFGTLLDRAGLPSNLAMQIQTLSGGQRTKLLLLRHFLADPDILLLDEPSNHLDQAGTQWLIDQIQQRKGCTLVISHDRTLLTSIQQFLVLDEQGVHAYTTDFESLRTQLHQQRQKLTEQIAATKSEIKKEQNLQQRRLEQAQQRQKQGEKIRKSGSQPKVLLDAKKNRAQNATGALKQHALQRLEAKKSALCEQQQRQTNRSKLPLTYQTGSNRHGRAVEVTNLLLPYLDQSPLTFTLERGDRCQIEGCNGSGKSTLIKCLIGELTPKSGHCLLHGEALYLDQHLSLLDDYESPFTLIQTRLAQPSGEVRTLLASIGFRGERAFLPMAALSGGERMKLALLLISQLPSSGILVMDEVDNHLDLESQDQLADTLAQYQGTLIFVCHQNGWLKSNQVINLEKR